MTQDSDSQDVQISDQEQNIDGYGQDGYGTGYVQEHQRIENALAVCGRLSGWTGAPRALFFHYSTRELFQDGIIDALRDNGFDVCTFCFNGCYNCFGIDTTQKAMIEIARTCQPDWILMQLQFYDHMVVPETVSTIVKTCPNACVVNTSVDIRKEAVPYFVEIGKLIHKSLIPAQGQLQMYREAGCQNVDFWQHGYDPKYFFRMSDPKRSELHRRFGHDVSFCANRNQSARFPGSTLRDTIVTGLSEKYGTRFALYGQNWDELNVGSSLRFPLTFHAQNNVYNSSLVVVSANHFNKLEKCVSNRQFIAMAAGTVVVSSYVAGMEEHFVHGRDLLWFRTADECVELCQYCIRNTEDADRIGRAGALKAANGHTYYHRIRELAERLGFAVRRPEFPKENGESWK